MENLEKSRECFSLRNSHRTLVLAASDTRPERRCTVSCWLRCKVSLDAEPAEVNTSDARAVTRVSLVPSVRWSVEEEPATPDVSDPGWNTPSLRTGPVCT